METLTKLWDKVVGNGPRDIHKEWIKQREMAAQYGPSHVNEIDAIFARDPRF